MASCKLDGAALTGFIDPTVVACCVPDVVAPPELPKQF